MQKRRDVLRASIFFIVSTVYSTCNTYVQSGTVYYYDQTPEYKKSPSGYLTSFANYYFEFNAYGLTYALGAEGDHISLKIVEAIHTRLTHIRKNTLNELNTYSASNARYYRPHLYKAGAQFVAASTLAGVCLHFCVQKIPYSDDKVEYIPPILAGISSLSLMPFGINSIIDAHPAVHAKKLNTRLQDIDDVIALVEDIIQSRTEHNHMPDQQNQSDKE